MWCWSYVRWPLWTGRCVGLLLLGCPGTQTRKLQHFSHRYDIAQSFLRVLYRAFTFQSGGLAVLLYLAAAVVNQISIAPEERMTLYYHNATAATDRQPIALPEQVLES